VPLPRATDRRRLLALLPTALFGLGAGCLGLDPVDDLTVYNNTGRAVTVDVDVTRATGTVDDTDSSVFSTEWSLDADAERRARDPVPASGQFTLTVSVRGLTTASHAWRRPGPTEGLVVWLDAEGIEFGTLTN
jgi:hypothetical protein